MSKNGELPVSALSVGIVHQMADNKFQLCSSHVTLKMTYKCGWAILLLINQSAAESKTWSNQTRINHCFWQLESHSQWNGWWCKGSHVKTRLDYCLPIQGLNYPKSTFLDWITPERPTIPVPFFNVINVAFCCATIAQIPWIILRICWCINFVRVWKIWWPCLSEEAGLVWLCLSFYRFK